MKLRLMIAFAWLSLWVVPLHADNCSADWFNVDD